MKSFWLGLFLLARLIAAFEVDQLKITSDYETAKTLLSVYQKPILVAFLGSNPSEESLKIIAQLKQAEFIEGLSDQIGVYIADLNAGFFSEKENERYFELVSQLKVTTFPTFVLCVEGFQEITRYGNLVWEPKEWAKRLSQAYFEYSWIQNKLKEKEKESLLPLYEKAAVLGCSSLQLAILDCAFQFNEIDDELKIAQYLRLIREEKAVEEIEAFRNRYLVPSFIKDDYLLQRIALIDFQFGFPLNPLEKQILEKEETLSQSSDSLKNSLVEQEKKTHS